MKGISKSSNVNGRPILGIFLFSEIRFRKGDGDETPCRLEDAQNGTETPGYVLCGFRARTPNRLLGRKEDIQRTLFNYSVKVSRGESKVPHVHLSVPHQGPVLPSHPINYNGRVVHVCNELVAVIVQVQRQIAIPTAYDRKEFN